MSVPQKPKAKQEGKYDPRMTRSASSSMSYDQFFTQVECNIIASVARRFTGSRKLETEDLMQEAAMAVLKARDRSKSEVTTAGYLHTAAVRTVLHLIRDSKADRRRVLDEADSIDASTGSTGQPEDMLNSVYRRSSRFFTPTEPVDSSCISEDTEARIGLNQLLRKLVLELEKTQRREAYLGLLQDLLANMNLAEPTAGATAARDLELLTKRPNARTNIPLGTLYRVHGLSQYHGRRFFEVVRETMNANGYSKSVDWIENGAKRKSTRWVDRGTEFAGTQVLAA